MTRGIKKEFMDFYENRHRNVKKSIHDRKHYLENTIKDICDKYNLYLPSHDREKIHQILKETRKILPQINGDRKRMSNIGFI